MLELLLQREEEENRFMNLSHSTLHRFLFILKIFKDLNFLLKKTKLKFRILKNLNKCWRQWNYIIVKWAENQRKILSTLFHQMIKWWLNEEIINLKNNKKCIKRFCIAPPFAIFRKLIFDKHPQRTFSNFYAEIIFLPSFIFSIINSFAIKCFVCLMGVK